jgi:superfamily II DNA or RNA helicase
MGGAVPGAVVEPALASLEFQGEWRHYQQAALEAFERDRQAGRRHTHIVAPPGSGKTLLGVEMVRRLGVPALVLVPNSAVQAQWLQIVGRFTGSAVPVREIARPDPQAPIACLSYQAFCQVDDPSVVLEGAAERRWAAERAAATGQPVEEVIREAAGWTGAAAARRRRELGRITAAIKREVARGEHGRLGLDELLSAPARRRIEVLLRRGVGTVVLDECHHLASLWGYVVRAVREALGEVHLVGLTATPPEELTRAELELYEGLLGPVDYTIPTPAVVREGHLAPYQELAWLCHPLDAETDWLAQHDQRFQELLTTLHDPQDSGPLSFAAWVITRARHRRLAGGEAEVSWASFQRRRPGLARACVRFLASAGLVLPEGAPRGEGYRQPPDLDDWLVLLEDYTLRCLRAHASPEAAARDQAIGAALRDLGFTLTRQGIRRGASDVDRLLSQSGAKALALADIVSCEYEARGLGLRALVLTDSEAPARRAADALVGVLAPEAGSAIAAVGALAADGRTSPLRPLLVSGRGLRCAPADAEALLEALRDAVAADGPVGGWRAEPAEPGLVQLLATGTAWQPRLWVRLATTIFAAGVTRVLVGTRALLGEGWDAPFLNALVDLTAATTAVSVRQMRGRSLRLDPGDPGKIASNWDVVCVAPELARGTGDYERFVRKHLHLFAPSEDGVIEAGPSHVHPDLGPFAPPPAGRFAAINQQMRHRVQRYEDARRRWRIGQPYAGQELDTLVVRPLREDARADPPARRAVPPAYPLHQRVPLGLAGLGAGGAALAAVSGGDLLALGLLAAVPAGLGAAWIRLRRTERELADAPPLDLVAHAIVEAYVELGELSGGAAASLAIEPRTSGYLRVFLRQATALESMLVTTALEQVLEPPEAPRYLVSSLVPGAGRGAARRLGRLLLARPPFPQRWHAVPDDLGRNKARAEAFARAWRRWLGPGQLRFTQRSDQGRSALAQAGAQAATHETKTRKIWV